MSTRLYYNDGFKNKMASMISWLDFFSYKLYKKYSIMRIWLTFKLLSLLLPFIEVKSNLKVFFVFYLVLILINFLLYVVNSNINELEQVTLAADSLFLSRFSLKVRSTIEMKVKQSIFFFLSYLNRINLMYTCWSYGFHLLDFCYMWKQNKLKIRPYQDNLFFFIETI